MNDSSVLQGKCLSNGFCIKYKQANKNMQLMDVIP